MLVFVFVTVIGNQRWRAQSQRDNQAEYRQQVFAIALYLPGFGSLWELSFDARMWSRQRTPALGGAGVQPL